MNKRLFFYIMLVVGLMTSFPACTDDRIEEPTADTKVPEGYISIQFQANVPDMNLVEVRAVDPDGVDISNMVLYCFNVYGLFIDACDAELTKANTTPSISGRFKADVPEETHIIHFVANQNSGLYKKEDFYNKSEAQVMAAMEGASGMLIYWARFEYNPSSAGTLQEQIGALNSTGGIKFIRNQAKICIEGFPSDTPHTYFDVTGFITANVHAFGTVAPYCSEHGFAIETWPNDHVTPTLPDRTAMMSSITAVDTKAEDYIFEHENTLDNPVSVIIKGRNKDQTEDLHYRVMLIDNTGKQLPILRNHQYNIKITGPLSYGQESFEDALVGPATNNVIVSVESWVNEVSDGTYTLSVDQTSAVLEAAKYAGKGYTVTYQLSRNDNGGLVDSDKPEVNWLTGNDVAANRVDHTFDKTTGVGTITMSLLSMSSESSQSGTLMIKKGGLYRTIEIVTVHQQAFTPAWIAAQVYGTEIGQNVTLKFTIPETCPEVLYPFSVLISTNSLDIRAASGQQLPVVREGQVDFWGDDNDWGYKYEYIVDRPGVHRLYFVNNLTHNNGETHEVSIEAKFFEKLTKTVVYANHRKTITLEGTSILQPEDESHTYADDEYVHYIKVPQKKNAFVELDMVLRDLEQTPIDGVYPAINAGEYDEFLIYSQKLNYFTGTSTTINGTTYQFDCEFESVNQEHWNSSTNGRVSVFRPKTRETDPAKSKGKYSLYMYTNTPVSDDVIRIASNTTGAVAHWDENKDSNGNYKGNTYRSVIFELLNYPPFHFNALVNGSGADKNKAHGTEEEEVLSVVNWHYDAPGQEVEVKFDIMEFVDAANNKTVDPLGTAFDIYIDAPMLELADNGTMPVRSGDDKGHFIYEVNENETLGTKTLKFKTKNITSSGEIKFSCDKNIVMYYDKTFKVMNNPITGKIQYNDGTSDKDIPANAFVSFALKKNGTRIGSITMTDEGEYSLNLRSEYEFGWTTSTDHTIDNRIELNYKAHDGKVYDMVIHDLAKLKDMADKNEPIVLTEQDDSALHNN